MEVPSSMIIVSFEGKEFEVAGEIVLVSDFLREMPDYTEKIFLDSLEIDTMTLELVLAYLEHYSYHLPGIRKKQLESTELTEHLEEAWDSEFIQSIDESVLLKLTLAVNKLAIRHLEDLCFLRIAMLFKNLELDDTEAEFAVDVRNLEEHEEFIKKMSFWALDVEDS